VIPAFRAMARRATLPIERELAQPDRRALDAALYPARLQQHRAAVEDALVGQVRARTG
jgi:hypothetical protein